VQNERIVRENLKGGTMNNLKKRREELSLTQKQVSDTLKIDIRLYQYYEAGQREPKVNAAIKIAEVLKTTVEKLFKDKTII
jgi:DNA-binding helix-turn-helix protein